MAVDARGWPVQGCQHYRGSKEWCFGLSTVNGSPWGCWGAWLAGWEGKDIIAGPRGGVLTIEHGDSGCQRSKVLTDTSDEEAWYPGMFTWGWGIIVDRMVVRNRGEKGALFTSGAHFCRIPSLNITRPNNYTKKRL